MFWLLEEIGRQVFGPTKRRKKGKYKERILAYDNKPIWYRHSNGKLESYKKPWKRKRSKKYDPGI